MNDARGGPKSRLNSVRGPGKPRYTGCTLGVHNPYTRVMYKICLRIGLLALLPIAAPALADPAEIVAAEAREAGGTWAFSVTLRHGDTGWDDYADGWRVVDADGAVLGTRVLYHPHVEEQPFTRSLNGVEIPSDLTTVFIEARTNTDGWGEARFAVDLSGR